VAPPDLAGRIEVLDDLEDAGDRVARLPEEFRHTVRMCFGMRCKIQRAAVIRPSQPPSARPAGRPETCRSHPCRVPTCGTRSPRCRAACCAKPWPDRDGRARLPDEIEGGDRQLVDLAEVVIQTGHFEPVAVRVHHAPPRRLSTAVPHRTAFLPPAFMAMFPPMQEASAEVGSTANTKPARSAASATRL